MFTSVIIIIFLIKLFEESFHHAIIR